MRKYQVRTVEEQSAVEEVFCFSDDDENVVAVRTVWAAGDFVVDCEEDEAIPENKNRDSGMIISNWPGYQVNWLRDDMEREIIWVSPSDKDPEEAKQIIDLLTPCWENFEEENPFDLMMENGWYLETEEYTIFGLADAELMAEVDDTDEQ